MVGDVLGLVAFIVLLLVIYRLARPQQAKELYRGWWKWVKSLFGS